MKKLFGEIDLTWKKIIIYAIIAGSYTALMALIPYTKETSFRDIAIMFEWWILFGILIICNSKSPLDSSLKCFVFFLISQPLVYLIQVPFSHMGWGLFGYYKYWFIWTLLTIPMGYIGYYIKKNNILSVVILLPMLILLAYLGVGYFNSMINNFPYHLLSFISCFGIIIVVVSNLFENKILRILLYGCVILFLVLYVVLRGDFFNHEYETYKSIEISSIDFSGDINITTFTATDRGNAEITGQNSEYVTVKIKGREKGHYSFTLEDENHKEYSFIYYYDKKDKTVVLEPKK